MGILFRISLRNLLRQKRRNLLLGTAISIGMALLVIANAFSHGISDVLFNRILSFVSGNISVTFTQNGNRMRQLFPDGDRMKAITRKAIPQMTSMEEAIGIFSRAIGNGRTDNAILVGMNLRGKTATKKQMADLEDNFRMIEGSYWDLTKDGYENPVLLAEEKAKGLNVGLHDVLRVRFQDVHGQNQAARLTVVGIFRPANVFMTAPVFLDMRDLKRMAGYGPSDIGQLYIMVPDPKKNAVRDADALHAALKPPLAAAYGQLESSGKTTPVTALGFRVDSASLENLGKIFPGSAGARRLPNTGILLGNEAAMALNLRAGDRCTLSYVSKFSEAPVQAIFKVTEVLPPSAALPGNVILVNDKDFYGFYYEGWPKSPSQGEGAFLPDSNSALNPYLCREWILFDRTRTTEELQKKYKLLPKLKSKAIVIDVPTMYESASMVINLEYALNLITLGAVLILFFIIQVGVVNTLRMTIRERTREIGTMRAIGMRRGDVRNIFLLESFFLALVSCGVGVLLAFVGMWLLRQIPIHSEGNHWDMLLVNGRLHFKPNALGTALYFLLIMAIATATAWFPARRAAKLLPSEALRHFG